MENLKWLVENWRTISAIAGVVGALVHVEAQHEARTEWNAPAGQHLKDAHDEIYQTRDMVMVTSNYFQSEINALKSK